MPSATAAVGDVVTGVATQIGRQIVVGGRRFGRVAADCVVEVSATSFDVSALALEPLSIGPRVGSWLADAPSSSRRAGRGGRR